MRLWGFLSLVLTILTVIQGLSLPDVCMNLGHQGSCNTDDPICPTATKCTPTNSGTEGICCNNQPRGEECPLSTGIILTCEITENSCEYDKDCLKFHKCCPEGCGKICKKIREVPTVK